MQLSWFNPIIDAVTLGLTIDEPSREQALVLLKQAAIDAGAEVHESVTITETQYRNLAVGACERGLRAYLKSSGAKETHDNISANTKAVLDKPPQSYWQKISGNDNPFVVLGRRVEKVNINYASKDELDALPGIGPVTAGRIIEYREANGPFSDLEELRFIQGLDAAARSKASATLTLEENSATAAHKLVKPNSLDNLSGFSALSRLKLTPAENGKALVALLTHLPNWLRLNRSPRAASAIPLSNKRVQTWLRPISTSNQVKDNWLGGGEVAALPGLRYLNFLVKLIEEAKTSIDVMMFFIRYDDETEYPINKVVDALIDAKQRGVKVRVVMDKDRENDVYLSRVINKDAMEKLRSFEVDARYDDPATLTHSKMIVVDGKHVILGSHNWTAGSMFAYDDLSLYLHSQSLAERQQERFEKHYNKAELG